MIFKGLFIDTFHYFTLLVIRFLKKLLKVSKRVPPLGVGKFIVITPLMIGVTEKEYWISERNYFFSNLTDIIYKNI